MLDETALFLFELSVLLLRVSQLGGQFLNLLHLLRDVVVQLSDFGLVVDGLLFRVILHGVHVLLQSEDFLVDLLCTQEGIQVT